ncbi:chemotaxis protein CheR [Pontibacillus halophilus JSM 076056 = DSM 19796]|uniref:protein-glutamate O-methyltransferase n=1 Tax=Pontibacillus halophilus JSM 076056 = DSM 19796 TaxID=1385510 RepID=A0A0A5I8J6_9BACI|nr:protein-glutamate O-methyltransferase CheR [Pontibacillus halophilus]KGX92162.1 chemotaxis protein CheR [Pontibacillus halophilus JSM 076056 = DSM 19796]
MQEDYQLFVQKMKQKSGIDLSLYKEAQMKRRLTTLRDKRGYSSFVSYLNAMSNDRQLYFEFLDRMTINVSEFFRNGKRWDVLRETILPNIVSGRSAIKVWSAACSTGEEPYTLAIILSELFPHKSIKVMATDLDEVAMGKAKKGVYAARSLQEVPDAWKKKYFTKEGDFYHISEEIKSKVTFKKHNLLADPYPKQMDLIVCRNVLIYFTEEAKEQVYRQFHQSLNEDGVLFVGSTEQIFNPQYYHFDVLDTFFYKKSRS